MGIAPLQIDRPTKLIYLRKMSSFQFSQRLLKKIDLAIHSASMPNLPLSSAELISSYAYKIPSPFSIPSPDNPLARIFFTKARNPAQGWVLGQSLLERAPAPYRSTPLKIWSPPPLNTVLITPTGDLLRPVVAPPFSLPAIPIPVQPDNHLYFQAISWLKQLFNAHQSTKNLSGPAPL